MFAPTPNVSTRNTPLLSVVLLSLLLSGCISYSTDTQLVTEQLQDKSLLSSIRPGETSVTWLVERWGHPNAVRDGGDGASRVWQYEDLAHSTTAVRALPLFAVELKKQSRTVYNFAVENDTIVRFWASQLP